MKFSSSNRTATLKSIQEQEFDLLIIGGGITGAGILVDAQSRGLSCCLIEKQDFSEGTSSRSTRLIHGGLRYLKQWQFKVVSDTGKERTIVQHIARHLTYPKKVVVPAVKGGNFSKFQLGLALWIYERLAKVPKKFRHISHSKDEIKASIPFIKSEDLLGGIQYYEFQTNDARLTIENIKKGVELGGKAINQTKVTKLLTENGKVNGIVAEDFFTNEKITVKAKCVINATGAWADQFNNSKNNITKRMSPSKGVHLVFPNERLPLSEAVYFDTPDKRMVFAIPDENCTYLGTTDTFYKGDIKDLTVTQEDITYLMKAVNNMFPHLNLEENDILSRWVGVRPLIYEKGKKPSEISRKHDIFEEDNGLLTIAGGKLTGFRKMAEKITNKVIDLHFQSNDLKDCYTKKLTLSGSDFATNEEFVEKKENFLAKNTAWSKEEMQWVYKLFGSQSDEVLQTEVNTTSTLPDYLLKTLFFSLSNEMIASPSDFLIRRTNLCYFHPKVTKEYWKEVAEIIYNHLNYSEEKRAFFNDKFIKDFKLAYNEK